MHRDARTSEAAVSFPGLSLTGRLAVVVGGTSGIGLALARGLSQAGADVVPTSRRIDQVETAAAEVEALGQRTLRVFCDLTEPPSPQVAPRKIVHPFTKVDLPV